MSRVLDRVLGRPLANREEHAERVGVTTAIPMLGLDALASAAYGPEAALTVLIPLGAAGAAYSAPILLVIAVILAIVALSYRQTIAAYPQGGGSFTVARENLGSTAGVVAGAALALDYLLNVAIGISAGVGALASAFPALLPHTLLLCLAMLAAITVVNLRGVRETGLALAVPTFAFVSMMALVIGVGAVRAISSGGAPHAVVVPQHPSHVVETASAWLLVRAFASGTTAMTGVEAVSNAVPLFRDPTVRHAQRTLSLIVAILIALLVGVAYLCRAYGITATTPGATGYQSVLSMLTAAVFGRGVLYYMTVASILAVLALSANTSFAGFPRVGRLLAEHHYLPRRFAERGRRLVFTPGIVLLAVLAAALLIGFGGVTDRLIPLFAVGALLAFTTSQIGMIAHWRRTPGRHRGKSIALNAVGAIATGITLVIVAVSKFTDGAWLVVIAVPAISLVFHVIRRHHDRVFDHIACDEPLRAQSRERPVAVIAAAGWNRAARRGLELALRLTDDVHVAHVVTDHDEGSALRDRWDELVAGPARRSALPEPRLVLLQSPYRQFFKPFVALVRDLERDHPTREIFVVIPELIVHHWYEGLLHNHRGRLLRGLLLAHCSDRVIVISAPYHLR